VDVNITIGCHKTHRCRQEQSKHRPRHTYAHAK
jgi:hypothetical protein